MRTRSGVEGGGGTKGGGAGGIDAVRERSPAAERGPAHETEER